MDGNENMVVFVDPDADGLCSSYIMYDYLKNKLQCENVSLLWNERSQGHGIDVSKDRVDKNTDLILLIDSSTSDTEACKYLSEHMDIVIIDHHLPERDNPYATIVNPQLQKEYGNKDGSATLLTFKVVELLDYKYKKVNIENYIDVVGLSTLSDQMDMTVMENRFFVNEGMKRIRNVGLLAMIHATKNNGKEVDSQMLNYNIIPLLNTTARNDELKKGLMILLEKDFFKAKRMADVLVQDNDKRKKYVRELVDGYMDELQDEKFAYVVTKNSSKGYNGLAASQIAGTLRKPALVLKNDGEYYSGSGRTYGDFDMRSFVERSGLIEYAAGHEQAFGFSVKASNWDKFKQYVNENIDESQFEPVIEYDIELDEGELDWDVVDQIQKVDKLWGNSNPPTTVKLSGVFVEDRELFPPSRKEHVKIKADLFDALKFNDEEYADDVDSWDSIDVLGSVGVNEWGGNRRIQVFIEDYRKQ